MSEKTEALRLAEACEAECTRTVHLDVMHQATANELRRLHAECEALRQANEAFARRQEWWNDRMCALEAECEALRADAARLAWLHSPEALDVDGWEWGVFRVKWKGLHVDIQQTLSDYSDLDAAMAKEQTK